MEAQYRFPFLDLYFRTLFHPTTSYHADHPIRVRRMSVACLICPYLHAPRRPIHSLTLLSNTHPPTPPQMTERSGHIRVRIVSMQRITAPGDRRGVVVRFFDAGPDYSPYVPLNRSTILHSTPLRPPMPPSRTPTPTMSSPIPNRLVHRSAYAVKKIDASLLPPSPYSNITHLPHPASFGPGCGGHYQPPAAVAVGVGNGPVGPMGMAAAGPGPMGGGLGIRDQKMPPTTMMGGA